MIARRQLSATTVLALVCGAAAAWHLARPSLAESPTQAGAPVYLAAVLDTDPLTVHFSLGNPGDAAGPIWVPRLLEPTGAFVSMAVRASNGTAVCQSERPKLKSKLHPKKDQSYVQLEPAYTHGAVLKLDGCRLSRGRYQLELGYSNLQYQGSAAHPLGALTHKATLPVVVD